MPNIKRLILKRFGGTSNFVLFVLLTFVCYLVFKNYFLDTNTNENENSQRLSDGIKFVKDGKVFGVGLLVFNE